MHRSTVGGHVALGGPCPPQFQGISILTSREHDDDSVEARDFQSWLVASRRVPGSRGWTCSPVPATPRPLRAGPVTRTPWLRRASNPEFLAGHGIDEVADHYAEIIAGLDSPPILVGHSFGGTIVEELLGEGLSAAGIAIDAAPIKGVLPVQGSPTTSKEVGTIPSSYTEGSGTIQSGTTATSRRVAEEGPSSARDAPGRRPGGEVHVPEALSISHSRSSNRTASHDRLRRPRHPFVRGSCTKG